MGLMAHYEIKGVLNLKDAWVLRLKDESKEDGMVGDFYYDDSDFDNECGFDFLTQDLNNATIFDDKEETIEQLKLYEKAIFEKYGKDAICNFGYTNIMNNFEFVEVEVEILKS